MTRPLRKAHRIVWVALAVALPLLLVIGVLARRTPTPVNAELRVPPPQANEVHPK